MVKKMQVFCALLSLACYTNAEPGICKEEPSGLKEVTLGTLKPRGDRRVIYNSDPSNTTSQLSDPAAQPKELREIVRKYAKEGNIDTLVQEVFSEAMTVFWRTDKCPYDVRYWHQRLVPMMDASLMPIEVYIDECHKQGMEFIAGFRMNDRHGQNPDFFEKLSNEHPDWILTDYKPSWEGAPPRSHKYGCALNYSVEGVRNFLFEIMEEVANRFDIDGIEFNFTRLAECFPIGKAEESHSIMTSFVRRVRKMLDEAGKKKERELILGVRVPQQLEGCKKMGFDVPTWIEERLIDYVAPGDFGFTDFNERYEDFVRLSRSYDCYVYPQVQPRIGIRSGLHMVPSRYRAAVQNFYGAGADGFSTQNFFHNWAPSFAVPGEDGPSVPEMYPKALNYLKELRSPESIAAAGDRHYVFHPLWLGSGPNGEGMSGIYKQEQIVLNRQQLGDRGEFRFRICERLAPRSKISGDTLLSGVMLLFRPDIAPGDEIEVDINGKRVPAEDIEYQWYDEKGRPPLCTLALTSPPAVYGDNYLGLKLVKSTPEAQGDVVLLEVEVMVKAAE